jgi:lysozyme family protein
MTAREAVDRSVRQFEGGISNHPDDRGGLTRFGLTLREYLRLRPGNGEAQFRALTRDEVIDILTEEWALKPGYWRIADQWLMWAVIDFAIHSGPVVATKALQRALGIPADGVFGRQTELAVSSTDPERLFRRLMANRVRHFAQIIRRNPSQLSFAGGWFERAALILESA